MTKRQIAKLDAILAKLETLENQVSDNRLRERLGAAKRELLRAYTSFVES